MKFVKWFFSNIVLGLLYLIYTCTFYWIGMFLVQLGKCLTGLGNVLSLNFNVKENVQQYQPTNTQE